MRSMPSNCRCCDSELEHGGKLCQSCREDLSSSLYDVPTLLKAWESYSKHFGPRAVEAAEQDKLGEALELLRTATGTFDPRDRHERQIIDKIDELLAMLPPKGTT